jgi:hypothetical protein
MGGFAASIRSAVAVALTATKGLATNSAGTLMTVTHQAWTGPDEYDVPVARPALVQKGATHKKGPNGQVVTTGTRIGFLDPVPANGAAGRQEPIDPRDLITLQGEEDPGHIIEVPGVLADPETGLPFVSVVWLA